jgi:microcystin-dependent protein
MEAFMGMIMPVAFNYAPQGWLVCDGSTLSISQFSALYALLGTTYGGDGVTSFKLPDLRGRTVLGSGSGPGLSTYENGTAGGVESITLNIMQMPQHTHIAMANVSNAQASLTSPTAGSSIAAPGTGGGRAPFVATNGFAAAAPNVALNGGTVTNMPMGGSSPHENRQPYMALTYIICINGLWPARP